LQKEYKNQMKEQSDAKLKEALALLERSSTMSSPVFEKLCCCVMPAETLYIRLLLWLTKIKYTKKVLDIYKCCTHCVQHTHIHV
jgi:hypothetical protein